MSAKIYITNVKILSILFVILLFAICFFFAYRTQYIPEEPFPLSNGKTEAMFYIENSESGTITCIGDGLVKSSKEITNNTSAVNDAIITSPDYRNYISNNLTIVWHSIEKNFDHLCVLGYITSTDTSNITSDKPISFINTTSLKRATLKEGQTVKTYCFLNEGDLGGATYNISAYQTYNHPNLSLRLANGLFANIQITNHVINVASMGIFPNQDMAPLFYKLEKALNSDVTEYRFNDGTYYLSSPIRLGGYTYTGSSSTTWAVDPSFAVKTYRVIRADSKDWNNAPLNLTISNINFLYEINKNSILTQCETILLAISGCDNCNIYNCTFTAKPSSKNGSYAKVDLLWFRDGYTKNVKIENSQFTNYSCSENSSAHLIGGCFWYMGDNGQTVDSILVNNCNFTNTNSDEAVGLWNGAFNHVEFNKCNFRSAIHQCDGIVGLNSAQFEKIFFNDCTFQSDIGTKKMLYFYKVKPTSNSDIRVNNCTFINNNIDPDSMVPGDGDVNAFIYCPFNEDFVWTLNVENSKFISNTDNYLIKSIVNIFNSPNVECNFSESNTVDVTTKSKQISRVYTMGNFYPNNP